MSASRPRPGPRADSRPATLALRPGLRDHVVRGRPVLPAVEALDALAREARQREPQLVVQEMRDAAFLRFLDLPAAGDALDVVVETRPEPGGAVAASLLTRSTAGSAGVVRAREHARVVFGDAAELPVLPPDLVLPGGLLLCVEPERLYAELVPFGPAFRNARAPVLLGREGAVARLAAPADAPGFGPLGSGLPFDAALHVACAWGQRFRGRVLFPAAIAARRVLRPIAPGEPLWGRVTPVAQGADHADFDVSIWDDTGELRETASGVRLADLFHGAVAVPGWVTAGAADADPLAPLRAACAGLVVLELDALPPFFARALTARERARLAELGEDRGRSFGGARLALKRLARGLYPRAAGAPADAIETVWPDGTHPALELAGLPDGLHHVAAAHDARFVVAVAGDEPIGIDVEPLGGRALKGARLFASAEEQRRIRECGLDPQEAALLVWTAKEAAAKALDVPLATAWRRCEARALGAERTELIVDGRPATALHARLADHIFTLLSLPGAAAGTP